MMMLSNEMIYLPRFPLSKLHKNLIMLLNDPERNNSLNFWVTYNLDE